MDLRSYFDPTNWVLRTYIHVRGFCRFRPSPGDTFFSRFFLKTFWGWHGLLRILQDLFRAFSDLFHYSEHCPEVSDFVFAFFIIFFTVQNISDAFYFSIFQIWWTLCFACYFLEKSMGLNSAIAGGFQPPGRPTDILFEEGGAPGLSVAKENFEMERKSRR